MITDGSRLRGARPLPWPARLGLVREILPAYVRLRRALRRGNLPTTLALARAPEPVEDQAAPLDYLPARRLGRAVERTLGPIPAQSRCLMQSLVLIELLARRGTTGSLVIGVKPGASFGAHAWVELGGLPLLPATDGTFQRLVEL